MGLILVFPGRSHGHSHGGNTATRGEGTQSIEEPQNINIRAAFIHILGDTLCTLGLLIAAIIIKFRVRKQPSVTLVLLSPIWEKARERCSRQKNCFRLN